MCALLGSNTRMCALLGYDTRMCALLGYDTRTCPLLRSNTRMCALFGYYTRTCALLEVQHLYVCTFAGPTLCERGTCAILELILSQVIYYRNICIIYKTWTLMKDWKIIIKFCHQKNRSSINKMCRASNVTWLVTARTDSKQLLGQFCRATQLLQDSLNQRKLH